MSRTNGAKPVGVTQVFRGDGLGLERDEVRKQGSQQPILVVDDPAESFAERAGVVEIGHPDAMHPAHLVAIAGTDPAPGRTQVVGRGGRFLGQPLFGQMVWQDDVCPVADVQPPTHVDALRRQGFKLLQQGGRMDDHAIADDAVDPWAEDSRRNQRELVGHAFHDDRVPGVGAPLIPNDHIMLVAQQVNDLPLGLISPLKPHHARRTHGACSPVVAQRDRTGHLVR